MERRAIVVRGIVQGVGFRPFVYHLAARLELRGFVQNQTGTVRIEVEGPPDRLEEFLSELSAHPPPLARISALTWDRIHLQGEAAFRIAPSQGNAEVSLFVSPDVATCPDCLAELFDPADRRFGYPFSNCTNCGPRLTVITGAPYDRSRTTLASFALCAACRAEYDNPADRRFHAQPTACADCGPRLQLHTARGDPLDEPDPVAAFARALAEGAVGALKGLGGYHLVCDAGNADAVTRLRQRKHRDEKPFAVMVADLQAARESCLISAAEEEQLSSPRRPIVLLRKLPEARLAEGVAPGNPFLGVMLPYTPLHHLLLRAMGRPLVMTSGNRSDEPIAHEDADALDRLADIADLFLLHDRPIHVRCDDSVTRIVGDAELPLRRSRGYAPEPIALPLECPQPILAVGGQLKNTFALGRGRHAFLSHHLGDLDHYSARLAFERDIALYEGLFAVAPAWIARDLHPDYASTAFALERASRTGARLFGVQHHHAHVAACMTEHGLTGPVLGVAFDGAGYGSDGAVWGGEFLVADARRFRRAAHLRYVGLPGGDLAAREPWRMALAHLHDAGIDHPALTARLSPVEVRTVLRMLDRRFNSPPTSSAGRLFDAVAALAGVRLRANHEAQAALELEWLATGQPAQGSYPLDVFARPGHDPLGVLEIDTRPLVRAVCRDARAGEGGAGIARRFHTWVVDLIAGVCGRLRQQTGLTDVVLSGGVFLNALLTAEACRRLNEEGFHVYRHRLVPPGDGGLSLGQLVVAAACGRPGADE